MFVKIRQQPVLLDSSRFIVHKGSDDRLGGEITGSKRQRTQDRPESVPDASNSSFAQQLQVERLGKKIPIQALAHAVNISAILLASFERGEEVPASNVIETILHTIETWASE